jgi:hypothetical protein
MRPWRTTKYEKRRTHHTSLLSIDSSASFHSNAFIAHLPCFAIDAVALFKASSSSFCNHECILPDDGAPNPMITRRTLSRTFVTLGCVVLLVTAAMHCLAYQKFAAPAVHASNLPIAQQSVFEIAFLSMAWSWIVLALILLVVTFGEVRLGKAIALICGFAVLVQAIITVLMVGFFIGNEMLGAASLLIIIGGFLFQGSRVET